ncbi:MAG: preprotein translocase subunit SecE [Epsilonproteobacteria bacterium]|nr:preprotein translocase subunit SecE [Campylobacterota bacterium]
MEKFIKFVKEAKIELEKVIFPTKEQVRQAFIAVVIVVAAVSAYLALIDLIMSSIIQKIL